MMRTYCDKTMHTATYNESGELSAQKEISILLQQVIRKYKSSIENINEKTMLFTCENTML